MKGPLLGLVMLVHDDVDVVTPALESVRALVDRWAVLDLGSKDGTPERVGEVLAEVPGVVYRTAPSQGEGRNAVEPAFVLLLEPDEELRGGADLRAFLELERDARNPREGYRLAIEGATTVEAVRVLRTPPGGIADVARLLAWGHALPAAEGRIPHATIACGRGAAGPERARRRLRRDAMMLEAAVSRRPHDGETLFRLGLTQVELGHHQQAMATLERRIRLGGDEDEVFQARLLRARAAQDAHEEWAHVLEQYLIAHASAPERPEPLYQIALHYAAEPALCHLFAKRALELVDGAGAGLPAGLEVDGAKLATLAELSARWLGDREPEPETPRRPRRRKRG